MAVIDQAGNQRVAIRACDNILSSRVYVCNRNDIGIIETATEFIKQIMQTGVAVR